MQCRQEAEHSLGLACRLDCKQGVTLLSGCSWETLCLCFSNKAALSAYSDLVM